MGSRVMHLIIAKRIAESYDVENYTKFLQGSLAPDASKNKELSHFFAGNQEDFTRKVDFKYFFNKYKDEIDESYLLGYYTHLIADDIWLKGFYLPWLRNRIDHDQDTLKLYHNDFYLLNGKLLNYYGYKDAFTNDLSQSVVIDTLEEVNQDEVKQFIPLAINDFNYSKTDVQQTLNVFTLEQIIGYIETSVELGLYYLEDI